MSREEERRKMLPDALGGGSDAIQPVAGSEREYVAEIMIPLDLKPGDKVKWVSEAFRDKKHPELEQVVEVFRVLDAPLRHPVSGGNHDADELNFTVMFKKTMAITSNSPSTAAASKKSSSTQPGAALDERLPGTSYLYASVQCLAHITTRSNYESL